MLALVSLRLLPIALMTLLASLAPAQAQGRYVPRFKAGLIAGLTASQIDGDDVFLRHAELTQALACRYDWMPSPR